MPALSGKISDKLRALLAPNDTAWTPVRPPDSKPMPKTGVKGVALGGRTKKKS